MSRSYKKTPYCGDNKTVGKKLANKCVRNGKYKDYDIPDGSWYKKIFCQYDVCDYYSIQTWEQCLTWTKEYCLKYPGVGRLREKSFNEKNTYRTWYKYYKGK